MDILIYMPSIAIVSIGTLLVVFLYKISIWISNRSLITPPDPIPRACKISRVVETLAMVCMGFGLLIAMPEKNLLDIFFSTEFEVPVAHKIIALLSILGLLIAIPIALLKRCEVALMITVLILVAYTIHIVVSFQDWKRIPVKIGKADSEVLTISLSPPVKGVDVSVNGVLLGKTPLNIKKSELHEKIPYWQEEPEEMDSGRFYIKHGLFNGSTWELPKRKWYPTKFGLNKVRSPKTYYIQLKLNNDEGCLYGDSTSSNNHINIGAWFPDRDRQMEALLLQGRLNNYKVDSKWFEAMETFNNEGWDKLLELVQDEPQWDKVLDEWSIHHFGLTDIDGSRSAWRAFESLCDRIEGDIIYSTTGISGRAVKILVPELDAKKLVKEAIDYVDSPAIRVIRYIQQDDDFSYTPELVRGIHQERGLAPVRSFPVMHAVWLLDKEYDAGMRTGTNLVEEKFIPALVSWHTSETALKFAASIGGRKVGKFFLRNPSLVENYYVRNFVPHSHNFRRLKMHFELAPLIAKMSGPEGTRFRAEETNTVLEIANAVVFDLQHANRPDNLDFLFLDSGHALAWKFWPLLLRSTHYLVLADKPEFLWHFLAKLDPLTDDTITYDYPLWEIRTGSGADNSNISAVSDNTRGGGRRSSRMRRGRMATATTSSARIGGWAPVAYNDPSWYLRGARLEKIPFIEFYIRAWKHVREVWGDRFPPNCADLFKSLGNLPTSRQHEIFLALRDYLRQDSFVSELKMDEKELERTLLLIDEALVILAEPQTVERYLSELRKPDAEEMRENFAEWLRLEEPDNCLVEFLAKENDAGLRMMVMGALEAYPSVRNQAILEALVEDPDSEVRNRAKAIKTEHTRLKNMPASELAKAQPPSFIEAREPQPQTSATGRVYAF